MLSSTLNCFIQFLLSILLIQFSYGQSVIYVTQSGNGNFSGSSWENALPGTQLQSRLSLATAGTQFWISSGTYKPTTGLDRTLSFTIPSGVQVYGGFGGNESQLADRNLTQPSSTTFSGDIGTIGNSGDNSYHVVFFGQAPIIPSLDGVCVIQGNANTNSVNGARYGGGIYVGQSSPRIENCIIESNYALDGGGLYLDTYNSAPVTTNVYVNKCSFRYNTALGGGGIEASMYANRGMSVICCDFRNNSAQSGGGISSGINGEYLNCLFVNNSANYGGAISAGIFTGGAQKSTFRNCTLIGNSASISGGGIHNSVAAGTGSTSTSNIINSIIRDNTAPTGPNVDFAGGVSTITYSNIQGGFTGSGNIDIDPMFVEPANGNYRLQPASPCINTGSAASNTSMTDLAGNTRVINGLIDMGAYERQLVSGSISTQRDGNWNEPTVWLYQQLPSAGDTILIRHQVNLPASYRADIHAVQYDTGGQLFFLPASSVSLN